MVDTIVHTKKLILATEKTPRTKCEYASRLILEEITTIDGLLEFKEYRSHQEIFPDDRKDNTPYTIDGDYGGSSEGLEVAILNFLARKNKYSVYKNLRLLTA